MRGVKMCLLWLCEELGKEISSIVFIIWESRTNYFPEYPFFLIKWSDDKKYSWWC